MLVQKINLISDNATEMSPSLKTHFQLRTPKLTKQSLWIFVISFQATFARVFRSVLIYCSFFMQSDTIWHNRRRSMQRSLLSSNLLSINKRLIKATLINKNNNDEVIGPFSVCFGSADQNFPVLFHTHISRQHCSQPQLFSDKHLWYIHS